MHFTRDRVSGLAELHELDDVYVRERIQAVPAKYQTLVTDGLACGVELCQGILLRPNIPKLRATWDRIIMLAETWICTPNDALSVTGTLQWFDLLVRPKLAGYHSVYAFGRITPDDEAQSIPQDVLTEWCLSLLLAPAWIVDLTSLVSTDIIATDASTSFVLVVSHAHVDNATAEAVLSFDDKRGDYITIALGLEEPTPKDRKGIPRELPLDKYDFADVLMIPWPHDERPEVVELRALLSGVKWLLRSAKRIGRRQIF